MEKAIRALIHQYKDQDLLQVQVTCPDLGVAIDMTLHKETEHHRINQSLHGGQGKVVLVLHEMKDKYQLLAELIADRMSLSLVERERALFKKVADYDENSVVITDSEGNIRYVNYHFEKMTGYQQVEVMGENPRVLKSGEQSDAFYEELWQEIAAGRPWRGEFHNKRKDGSTFWERARILPIDLEAETVYVAYKTDIALQKGIEEALILKNRHLVEVLEELNRTQEALYEHEHLAGIADLAAGVAHEINTPLGVLRSNLAFLAVEAAGLSDEEVKEAFSDVDQAIDHIDHVVKALGRFAQTDRMPGAGYYDLKEGVDAVLTLLSPEMPEGLVVKKTIETSPLYCEGTLMNQVLYQVLRNGVEALARSAEGTNLSIKAVQDEDGLTIVIGDDGPGISPEAMKRIYNPFYSTKEVGDGMGLGLHRVRRVVTEQMKGTVKIASTEGEGTQVEIVLPRYMEHLE